MEIKYNNQFFKILNNCSHIANMIAIQNKDGKNVVFHKNSGMSFRFISPKEMFDAGDMKIAFNNFSEFYNIVDTFKDAPNISIDETNIAKINSGEVEINYTLGNYDVTEMVQSEIELDEVQGKIIINSDKLVEIKKFAGLMGMKQDAAQAKINVNSTGKKIKISFTNQLSQDKLEYEFDNISDTPIDFNEDINVGTIMDLPGADYEISFSTKDLKLVQMRVKTESDYQLDFFAGYKNTRN